MAAVAEREQSEHDFIGQVFSKASPILTWRPVKVQRITPTPVGSDARPSDHSGYRFSRATTRRMAALPVVDHGRSSKRRAFRALLTLVAFSLLCGSALTLCVYVLLGDSATAWRPSPPSTRVAVTHVLGPRIDTLAPAPVPLPLLAGAAAATVEPHRPAVRPPRAQHVAPRGARGPRYPASALHAGRSPHGAGGPSRGTT